MNVGSVLFRYNGEIFGPYAAKSGGGGIITHSERTSLVKAINENIEQLPPFMGLNEVTPESLIKPEENLLRALAQLDNIYIFSERAPCDYKGVGCKPLLTQLDKDLGNNKIILYSYLPEFMQEENN